MSIDPPGILSVFQAGKKGKTVLCDTLSFYSEKETLTAEFCLPLIVNSVPQLLKYKRRWEIEYSIFQLLQ